MGAIGERIREALKLRNMKQSKLSVITGIGKSSISTYLSGAYEPKSKNITKIAEALNVNETWLLGNDVPIKRFRCNTNNFDTDNCKILNNEANFLDKMAKFYQLLNKLGLEEAIKRICELTELSQYKK